MNARVGSSIGWICAILIGALNIFAGIMKFVPMDPASKGAQFMAQLGVTPGIEHVLGVLEFIIVILFLIPRTSTVGFVLIVGYMAGALATNITHGVGFADTIPLYVSLLLLTVSAWFRNPELVSRLLKKPMPAQM